VRSMSGHTPATGWVAASQCRYRRVGRVLRQTAPVSCDRPQCLQPRASRNIEHPLKKILLYRPGNQLTDELANALIS
jgi:hypothetical protein